MINYDPNIIMGTHTVKITLQIFGYVGHIYKKIGGNCRGLDILKCCDFESEEFEKDENDCQLSYDEEYDAFNAVLTNSGTGEKSEICESAEEFNNMIVGIEIIDYAEEKYDVF